MSSSHTLKLERLFRSTISPVDKNFITQALREAEKETRKLSVAIMSLERKRNELKERMERYRSLLSPIHRLPPEVLANIFTICGEDFNDIHPIKMPPAVAVSLVCGRWRSVALSTPFLWSSIRITFRNWEWGQHEKVARLTETYLSRSKTSPLHLKMDITCIDDGADVDITPALDVLVQNSSRWRTLDIICRPWVWQTSTLRGVRGRLSKLRHLRLSAFSDGEDDAADDLEIINTNIFDDCPDLHSLCLMPNSSDALSAIVLPWHQIQNLELESSEIRTAMLFITRCPNLQRVEFNNHNFIGMEEVDDVEVVTSSVKSLSISLYQSPQVFQVLTVPSLTSLEIGHLSFVRDLRPIEDCIRRSSCNLTSFKLGPAPVSCKQVLSLLSLMPKLQSLHIYEWDQPHLDRTQPYKIIADTFLHEFTRTSFLPQLRHLDLTAVEPLPQHAILDALASRCIPDGSEANVARLQSVSITTAQISSELLSLLESFSDVGVRMFVTIR
ncbi:hypothetical protein VNI00_000551 [Paramarasmius palmivorus]|uniref:F-box domain-containing protein n=1 Tax=Paramarasmius palmivorus TaxID=297713 RepID=A0AAW0E891_9AGAR